jgi:hypothetical protein
LSGKTIPAEIQHAVPTTLRSFPDTCVTSCNWNFADASVAYTLMPFLTRGFGGVFTVSWVESRFAVSYMKNTIL